MEALLLGGAQTAILSLGRALLLPTLVAWGFCHLNGVSLPYLTRCMYAEVALRLRRGLAPGDAEDEATRRKPPKLTEEQRAASLRGVAVLGAAEYTARGQTLPPTKKVAQLFPKDDAMPTGEEVPYDAASLARVGAKKRSLFGHLAGRRKEEDDAEGVEESEEWLQRRKCLREGAEVHRQVRQFVQQKVRPGLELREIVEMLEAASSTLVGFDPKVPLKRGWAFPTGISLNEVAAHDTVNPGDPSRWLQAADLVKLDFGVHIDGHILDCAFSFTFDAMHDELMAAVREATNVGIRHAGPDALVNEIGGVIQEVMESAEVHRPNGKVLPIYAIKNLTGHSIAPYKIHAGKSLPSVNTGGRMRMLAGELWAIETFGSSGGVGYVSNGSICSHFMRPDLAPPGMLKKKALSDNALSLLDLIDRRFSTLAFSPRWVVQEATRVKSPLLRSGPAGNPHKWWQDGLDELSNMGLVNRYPPLLDVPGCHVAQYEHTILLGSKGKEVLTRGCDY